MSSALIKIFTIFALMTCGAVYLCGQSADGRTPVYPKSGDKPDEDRPLSFNENLEKLRIAKEKRDHDEMIERGQEALKLSEDLEKSYNSNGRLTDKEIAKIASVEKLVKKIRNELGGDDDADNDDNTDSGGVQNATRTNSLSLPEAVKSLRESTGSLFDELKKTTRFSISAAAIQCSNSVLRLARFLRIAR